MAEIRQIQVDGVNYDLVISEDEVSATAAAQSAAQALAYKNQAQSSAAQAGQQATNASNQADRAEDAALRAEAIVGGEFVSYGQAQGLDDAQKAQARANIMAGGSNDNLLDNWYFVGGGSQLGDGKFPINQRGQTSYSVNSYNIDRWICYASDGSVTLNANGVTAPAYGVMTQPTANLTQLNGKTLTLSVLYETGLEVGTAVLDLSGSTIFINGNGGQAYITSGGLVQFYKEAQYTVKAVKLELGTVSTLVNDAPPDFGEELRKCKRRLRYVPLTRTPAVISGNTAVVTLNGIEMASVPTPALISAGGARDAGGMQSITSATVTGFTYNTPTVQFALAGNLNYVIGYVYDTVLQLSCEL